MSEVGFSGALAVSVLDGVPAIGASKESTVRPTHSDVPSLEYDMRRDGNGSWGQTPYFHDVDAARELAQLESLGY